MIMSRSTQSSIPRTDPMSTEISSENIWDRCFDHTAPQVAFTAEQARQVMREHRGCLRKDCDRKQSAWQVLVSANHIGPDIPTTP